MIGRRKSGLGTPLVLAVVCAGLGWVLYHDLEASIPPPERIDQPRVQLPPLPEEPDFALAPLQAFLAVVERPLFASNRRPPAQAAPVAAPEQPLGLALSGTVLSDQGQFALVRPTEGGAVQRLKIGDQLYERRAILITDAAERRRILRTPAGESLPEGVAVYRMDPRSG